MRYYCRMATIYDHRMITPHIPVGQCVEFRRADGWHQGTVKSRMGEWYTIALPEPKWGKDYVNVHRSDIRRCQL